MNLRFSLAHTLFHGESSYQINENFEFLNIPSKYQTKISQNGKLKIDKVGNMILHYRKLNLSRTKRHEKSQNCYKQGISVMVVGGGKWKWGNVHLDTLVKCNFGK